MDYNKYANPFNNIKDALEKNEFIKFEESRFKNINGIYRVLDSNKNYTENFGFQWNEFVNTQIDTEENEISKIRFFAETNWDKEDLTNKNILEVGSGAGRFSEVILNNTNANLYSIDYSNAVDANYTNNGHHRDRFKLFQASIYEMPFGLNQFDKVLCIGVLQHTPNFKKSVKYLVDQVKPGGELVIDFYPIKGFWTKINAKYILRPITKKIGHKKLLTIIEKNINWMIKLYYFLHKVKLGILTRFIPICDIYGTLPYKMLSKNQIREWCILDTFDMFSPEYDQPQRINTVKKWVEQFGLKVTLSGFINYGQSSAAVIRAIKEY